MVKRIIIIGAGLAGIIIANKLSKNPNIKVTLIEKSLEIGPVYNDLYLKNKSGLDFTRGAGKGGTSNLWHSGLIRIPSNVEFIKKISLQDWYEETERLLISSKENKKIESESIFYPFKRFKATVSKDVKVIISDNILKIDRVNNYIELKNGQLLNKIKYDFLVLSAGGLGSPELVQRYMTDLYQKNNNIGSNLTDHIYTSPAIIKLHKLKFMRFSFLRKLGIERPGYVIKDQNQGLNHIIYLRPLYSAEKLNRNGEDLRKILIGYWGSRNKFKDLIKILTNISLFIDLFVNKIPLPLPVWKLKILVVSEQHCLNKNNVKYDDIKKRTEVTWEVNSAEISSIKNALKRFQLSWKDQNFKSSSEVLNWENNVQMCCHHSGTMRISESMIDGVVNTDLKLHGTDNIYVCDGSVLPETSYANTGYTIAALALRLASTLIDKTNE